MTPALNFCSVCSHAITRRVPPGDNRERACCDHCGAIHYVNPKVVVGTLPVWGEQVLLCRRAIEPRLGFWTLPGGFLEITETTAAGAVRETDEEAGARVVLGPLFTMLDVVHVHQIHLFYLADLVDTDFMPGEESLEVRLFDEAGIPWQDLAFRTVSTTLQHFFDDRRRGRFELHTGTIEWAQRAPVNVAPPAAIAAGVGR
jgi:ADP-ribose pyrophosphatase YjhB (NUDIX family)